VEDVPHVDGDQVLAWLLAGNARFAEGRARHPHEGLRRRAALTDHQSPAGIVLGCADSRVPPELVFDAGLGDLFVIRVAGNVVKEDEAGSIEYAVEHLGVPLVLVLGHERCGAVTAALGAMDDEEAPELSRLLASVRPALVGLDPALPHDERIHAGVEANVRHSVARLREIIEREKSHHALPPGLRIVGGVYDLETGRVRILD
jgi:carbonic anhydrase